MQKAHHPSTGGFDLLYFLRTTGETILMYEQQYNLVN